MIYTITIDTERNDINVFHNTNMLFAAQMAQINIQHILEYAKVELPIGHRGQLIKIIKFIAKEGINRSDKVSQQSHC